MMKISNSMRRKPTVRSERFRFEFKTWKKIQPLVGGHFLLAISCITIANAFVFAHTHTKVINTRYIN